MDVVGSALAAFKLPTALGMRMVTVDVALIVRLQLLPVLVAEMEVVALLGWRRLVVVMHLRIVVAVVMCLRDAGCSESNCRCENRHHCQPDKLVWKHR